MYSVNVISLEAVKCVVYCMLRRFWSWYWLKICYQRKRYIYSEENCKKNSPVNTWMFWDFYYPIFNTKNSKRKTIRFWLKGSKNLQICFSIYLLKINFFFPIKMQKNNTMYSNQFFYTTTKSSNTFINWEFQFMN